MGLPGTTEFSGHKKILRNKKPVGCTIGGRWVAGCLRRSLGAFRIFMIVNVLVDGPGNSNKASRLPRGARDGQQHSGWRECLTWPNLFPPLVCNRLYEGVG